MSAVYLRMSVVDTCFMLGFCIFNQTSGFLVIYIHTAGVQDNIYFLVHIILYQTDLDCQELGAANGERDKRFTACGLIGVDPGFHRILVMRILGIDIHHFGAQTEYAVEFFVLGDLLIGLYRVVGIYIGAELTFDRQRVTVVKTSGIDEVDARVSDEVRSLQIDRVRIQAQWRVNLGDLAFLEQSDFGGHRQSFNLIVSDIDDRRAGFLVQTLQFGAHIDTKPCVEVGKRLVKQQKLRA